MNTSKGKSLEEILAMLASTQNIDERVELMEALAKFRNRRAAQPLIEALQDDNPRIRSIAVYSLVKMRNKQVVEPLLISLKNPESVNIYRVISDLGRLGDVRSIEPLAELLNHPDKTVRVLTTQAIGRVKDEKAFPYLLEALGHSDTRVWEAAQTALVRWGERVVEPLIEALKSDNLRLRSKAASTLTSIYGKIGYEHGKRVVEPLIEALKGSDTDVQIAVVSALGWFGDARAVEPLIAMLKDPDENVRQWVIGSLGSLGPTASPAIEPLIEVLSDHTNSSETRAAAVRSLGEIALNKKLNPQPIFEAFSEPDDELRLAAAWFLSKYDPSYSPAIDYLLETLSNPNSHTLDLFWAVDAIGELPAVIDRSIEPLIKLLNWPNAYLRIGTTQALGKLGDARALPALEQLLQHEDEKEVIEKVREAIDKIQHHQHQD
ncbi:MAG TPA: HEAT repeat domain-containing protein [Chloroflexia bacterium]|nr:HEAT repeat domain-containing protein [Chloroflexia bacterium]